MLKKLFSTKKSFLLLISLTIMVILMVSVLLLIKNDHQSISGFIKQINSKIITYFGSDKALAQSGENIFAVSQEGYIVKHTNTASHPEYLGEEWENINNEDNNGCDGNVSIYGYPDLPAWMIGAFENTETKTINKIRISNQAFNCCCYPDQMLKDFRFAVSTTGTASSNFTSIVEDQTGSTLGWYEFSFAPVQAKYIKFTMIRNWSGVEDGDWITVGEVEVYGVTNQPPNKPSGLSQQAGAEGSWIADNTPYFDFTISDPNSGDNVGYQIQIDDNSNFSSPVIDYTWSGSTINPNPVRYTVSSALANGSYYWRVRAKDGAGLTSAWADDDNGFAGTGLDFRVDTAAPTITSVTSSSPACNTIRFTVNGAADSGAGLHSTPYFFDAGTNWQANNYKDYSGTSYTIPANQIKVRDALGNTYTYPNSVLGSAQSCGLNVTLTVWDDDGLSDTETKTINISTMSACDFSFNLTNVSASACNLISGTWLKSLSYNSADDYSVYRCTSGCSSFSNYSSVTATKSCSDLGCAFDDSNVAPTTQYYYIISNPDALSNSTISPSCSGGLQPSGTICPLSATTPSCQPQDIKISHKCGSISLDWLKGEVASYKIKRCIGKTNGQPCEPSQEIISGINPDSCGSRCEYQDQEVIPVNIINPPDSSYYCYYVVGVSQGGKDSQPSEVICDYSYCYRAPSWQER